MRPLEVFGDDRYRTIDEARIVEALQFWGWRIQIEAGNGVQAELEAKAALKRFVELGLPYRNAADGGRLFDPAEAFCFVKWAAIYRGDPAWRDHFIPNYRREIWGSRPGAGSFSKPPAFESPGPDRFTMTVWRRFNLAGRRPGDRIRLRLPLPVEDSGVRDLSFEFLPPAGFTVQTSVSPARLDVLLEVPDTAEVTIGVRANFTTYQVNPDPAAKLDPAEFSLYTVADEGLIRISPRIRALAARLAGDEREPLAIVRRFWDFMFEELATGFIHYAMLDPSDPLAWVLEKGWFDCKTGSALIEGSGWLSFDFESWELSEGGTDADWRYYRFGRLDARVVVERLPRLFNGLGAIKLPEAWHMLQSAGYPGVLIDFEDVDTGKWVYRERVEVDLIGRGARPMSNDCTSGLPALTK